jgi:hypothetical protein
MPSSWTRATGAAPVAPKDEQATPATAATPTDYFKVGDPKEDEDEPTQKWKGPNRKMMPVPTQDSAKWHEDLKYVASLFTEEEELGEEMVEAFAKLEKEGRARNAWRRSKKDAILKERRLQEALDALQDIRVLEYDPNKDGVMTPEIRFRRLFDALGLQSEDFDELWAQPKREVPWPAEWNSINPKNWHPEDFEDSSLTFQQLKQDWLTMRQITRVLDSPKLEEVMQDRYHRRGSSKVDMSKKDFVDTREILQNIRDSDPESPDTYDYMALERLFYALGLTIEFDDAVVDLAERLCELHDLGIGFSTSRRTTKLKAAITNEKHRLKPDAFFVILRASLGLVPVASFMDEFGLEAKPTEPPVVAKVAKAVVLDVPMKITRASTNALKKLFGRMRTFHKARSDEADRIVDATGRAVQRVARATPQVSAAALKAGREAWQETAPEETAPAEQ